MTHAVDLQADVADILLSEERIQARVTELGRQITDDYAGRRLTLVSVLKGSLPFMADLMRVIDLPLRIDLMEVSSYGGTTTESSGLVRILKDLSASIAGEQVLLVEDIIDTGLTLNYLVRYLRGKNPASLRICTLLDKPARRLVDIPVLLAALATLALVALPFASERPTALDRWPSYLVVLGLAIVGYVLRVAGLIVEGPLLALRPDRAPGLFVVAVGLVGLARATFEIYQEPEMR